MENKEFLGFNYMNLKQYKELKFLYFFIIMLFITKDKGAFMHENMKDAFAFVYYIL